MAELHVDAEQALRAPASCCGQLQEAVWGTARKRRSTSNTMSLAPTSCVIITKGGRGMTKHKTQVERAGKREVIGN